MSAHCRLPGSLAGQFFIPELIHGALMPGSTFKPVSKSFVLLICALTVRTQIHGQAANPVITTQPQDLTLFRGETATFTVAATGLAPLKFQWTKGGTNLTAATESFLSLTNIRSKDAGTFRAVITDAAGG